MSRVADPTVGRHVFVLSGNVPADFADRVAARGGSISSSMSEIGVVVTQGLSDADATALAGKKKLPRRLPDLIGMGDESEAIAYAAEQLSAWRATPGALAWLDNGPR